MQLTARGNHRPSLAAATLALTTLIQPALAGATEANLGVDFPPAGAQLVGLLELHGTSNGATQLEFSLTVGGETIVRTIPAAEEWSVTIDTDLLPPGAAVLRAHADGGRPLVERALVVSADPEGHFLFGYPSRVDGATLMARAYRPAGAEPGERPLVCVLHGKGETPRIYGGMDRQLDLRGWSALVPFGRRWGAFPKRCTEKNAFAYIDHPFDDDFGPCESDVLDAIEAYQARFPVDPDRVYLCGFSAGGMGAYAIGLKNPDRFAAIGPMGAPTDWYELALGGRWASPESPDACQCMLGIVGGAPSTDPLTHTLYKITSARFLIENARNLPVFHAHGREDNVVPNAADGSCYRHADHILFDSTWSGCHRSDTDCGNPDAFPNTCHTDLDPLRACFGHTPTLTELADAHDGGYLFGYYFTRAGHAPRACWFEGSLAACTDPEGLPSLEHGGLMGMFEFFARQKRPASPDEVVFKTYTDTHRDAYWAAIDAAHPWANLPAAVRARRHLDDNRLELELVAVDAFEVDLDHAGLSVGEGTALSIQLAQLDDPVFGYELDSAVMPLAPRIVLVSAGLDCDAVSSVTLDGVRVPAQLVQCEAGRLTLGPFPVGTTASEILIQ